MAVTFQKAVKYDAKGRVALVGPAGSGKSMTALRLARALAGPEGKIAAVDTEHKSLSKYADQFDFDVLDMESYTPTNFLYALEVAEKAKYAVFITDSLSHFWMGKDGALEFVDSASRRYKDQMGGWKEFRPHERAMVDRMLASPCHIVVTMRTKTEYVEEINDKGKKVRRKVGLQPVQREGLEYEFDWVGYMEDNNDLITDKTRCSFYKERVLSKPSDKDFQPFVEWLKGAKRVAEEKPAPVPVVIASKTPEQLVASTSTQGENGAVDQLALPTLLKKIEGAKARFIEGGWEESFNTILSDHAADNIAAITNEGQAQDILQRLTTEFKALRKPVAA